MLNYFTCHFSNSAPLHRKRFIVGDFLQQCICVCDRTCSRAGIMAARNIHHHLSHSSSLPLFDTSPFLLLLPFRSSLSFHHLLLRPASIPSTPTVLHPPFTCPLPSSSLLSLLRPFFIPSSTIFTSHCSFTHFSSLPTVIIRLLPIFQSFYTSYPTQPNLH